MIRPINFVFLLLLLAGCGGHPTGTVSGTITYNDKPVEYGVIYFAPVDPTFPPPQGDIVHGKYTLSFLNDEKNVPTQGAYTGEYRIWISSYTHHTPGWTGNITLESKSLIPQKYESVNDSGLTATVTRGQNTLDFSLK